MKLKIKPNVGSGIIKGQDQHGNEYQVIGGELFCGETIQVEPYKEQNNVYIYHKMNYDDINVFSKHFDRNGLIEFSKLKEVSNKSKPYKRIYEIDGYWVSVIEDVINQVEYLYTHDLTDISRIKIAKIGRGFRGRMPVYSLDYIKLLKKVIETGKPEKSWFYCEREKDFDKGAYADLFIITNFNENNLQIQLWQIIGNGQELLYAHGFIDEVTFKYTHFDLAYHYVNPEMIEPFLNQKKRIDLTEKMKLIRLDGEIQQEHIFELIKMFFPFDYLVDEFTQKKYA